MKKKDDYRMLLTVGDKRMKFYMNNISAPSLTLRIKNTIYADLKHKEADLPYITEEDAERLKENRYIDLIGMRIDGVLVENARVEIRD